MEKVQRALSQYCMKCAVYKTCVSGHNIDTKKHTCCSTLGYITATHGSNRADHTDTTKLLRTHHTKSYTHGSHSATPPQICSPASQAKSTIFDLKLQVTSRVSSSVMKLHCKESYATSCTSIKPLPLEPGIGQEKLRHGSHSATPPLLPSLIKNGPMPTLMLPSICTTV
jgi:hypothetical protein